MFYAKKISDFISQIQKKDDKTRRKYLYLSSSVSMLIIVALWAVYLNTSVPLIQTTGNASSTAQASTSEPAAANYAMPDKAAGNQNSFFDTLGKGLSNISNSTIDGLGNVTNQIRNLAVNVWTGLENDLKRTNNFSVQKGGDQAGGTGTYSTDTLQSIPPTPLP